MSELATHCNTLQHTATQKTFFTHFALGQHVFGSIDNERISNTLQHTATRCNTLHHTATQKTFFRHFALGQHVFGSIDNECRSLTPPQVVYDSHWPALLSNRQKND